jgi:hypothetical protein
MRAPSPTIEERIRQIGSKATGASPVGSIASLRNALALGEAERVEQSTTTRTVARLRARVDGVREALVLRLRAEIERGDYRPNYTVVAEKLLRDLLEHVAS